MRGTLATRSTRRRSFDPRSIPGCVGWFDANNLGTTKTDGATQTTWPDLSGGGRDLSQATSGSRPLVKLDVRNGLNVLRFDGVDDWMGSTAAGLADIFNGTDLAGSVLVAGAITSTAVANRLVGWANSAADVAVLQYYNNTTVGWRSGRTDNAALTVNVNGAVPDTAWHVHSMCTPGTTTDLGLDGVLSTSAGAQDVGAMTTNRFAVATRPTLTLTGFMGGDLGEVIVYNRYLVAAERQLAERYLGRKWQVFV